MPADFDEAQGHKPDLRHYLRIVQRRRWWLVGPAFGVWTVVWLTAWFLPAVYRSETLILVEQQKVPEQYVVSNVAADLQERLQSMTQQILSRTHLLKIMDEFQLYPKLRARLSSDQLVEHMRQDIQIELVQSPGRKELSAFKIAYLAGKPNTAQQVTQQLSSLFIQENLKARQQQSQDTTDFLKSQLLQARQNLSDQEQKLKDFKSRYLGELPGQVQSNVQILGGTQAQLQQEMEALGHAKQQSVYLESLLSQWKALQSQPGTTNGAAPQTLVAIDQELERLRSQLVDLSSRYTERHPDVRKLKEQIASAESMKRQIEAAPASTESFKPRSTGTDERAAAPMMEVESQLKANRVETQNRERSIQRLQSQVGSYESRLNTTPLREQQLADLTRDYDQSRRYYESLLGKLDESEMATNLEKRQEGEQFRILDAPSLPQKPFSPDRTRLSLLGLVGGLVLGLISVAGTESADDRVYSSSDLESMVDAVVLADIPLLCTPDEEQASARQRRREWMSMAGMGACAVAGLALTYYFG